TSSPATLSVLVAEPRKLRAQGNEPADICSRDSAVGQCDFSQNSSCHPGSTRPASRLPESARLLTATRLTAAKTKMRPLFNDTLLVWRGGPRPPASRASGISDGIPFGIELGTLCQAGWSDIPRNPFSTRQLEPNLH